MPYLAPPTEVVRESFLDAMAEFRAEGRGSQDDQTMIGRELRLFSSTWHTTDGFTAFVASLQAQADPTHPSARAWVPCTTWWWIDHTEYLGRIAVRHRLNDQLRLIGGHIGYDVRPTARGRGHATAMLRAVLPLARALGITPAALVTCDAGNLASRKVIERCGGTLQDHYQGTRRYWVPTT